MEKLKEMACEKYSETYNYMDVLFYTVILSVALNASDFEFVRVVETEA